MPTTVKHISQQNYLTDIFLLRKLLMGQILLAVERKEQSCNCPNQPPISGRIHCALNKHVYLVNSNLIIQNDKA